MELIIQNPGFQHITEKILVNLSFEDIMAFQLVNKSCKKILDDPMVWIKKWISKGLSKKNQGKWIKAIQLTNNPNLMNTNWMKINIILYIQWIFHWNDDLDDDFDYFDIPCYINEKTVENFSNINFNDGDSIQRYCDQANADGDAGSLQIAWNLETVIIKLWRLKIS